MVLIHKTVHVVPTTSKLAEQERRDVSLAAVILYSPASDMSALLTVNEYVSPSDDIDSRSLLDSSVPSLYLTHAPVHSSSFLY